MSKVWIRIGRACPNPTRGVKVLHNSTFMPQKCIFYHTCAWISHFMMVLYCMAGCEENNYFLWKYSDVRVFPLDYLFRKYVPPSVWWQVAVCECVSWLTIWQLWPSALGAFGQRWWVLSGPVPPENRTTQRLQRNNVQWWLCICVCIKKKKKGIINGKNYISKNVLLNFFIYFTLFYLLFLI